MNRPMNPPPTLPQIPIPIASPIIARHVRSVVAVVVNRVDDVLMDMTITMTMIMARGHPAYQRLDDRIGSLALMRTRKCRRTNDGFTN